MLIATSGSTGTPKRVLLSRHAMRASAEATAELRALAERLGAPVVTTWNGKGAIDETHPLAGQTIGDTGSTIGNTLAASADVLLSVGNRFVDWSASSWRKGVTFALNLEYLEAEFYPVAVTGATSGATAQASLTVSGNATVCRSGRTGSSEGSGGVGSDMAQAIQTVYQAPGFQTARPEGGQSDTGLARQNTRTSVAVRGGASLVQRRVNPSGV